MDRGKCPRTHHCLVSMDTGFLIYWIPGYMIFLCYYHGPIYYIKTYRTTLLSKTFRIEAKTIYTDDAKMTLPVYRKIVRQHRPVLRQKFCTVIPIPLNSIAHICVRSRGVVQFSATKSGTAMHQDMKNNYLTTQSSVSILELFI